MIWGDSNMVYLLIFCVIEIIYFFEMWKVGLKKGFVVIYNLFREDIDFFYFRVLEDKN